MNSFTKFSGFELESPDSNVLTPIELNCEKVPEDTYEGLTTTEQNDQIFQNYMSLSKFKNTNFDGSASFGINKETPENNNINNISINSYRKNLSRNNSNITLKDIDVTPYKDEINNEKENKGKDSNGNYTPISTICNYYLQSESNLKTAKKKKMNVKKDNCKKNIYEYLNTPTVNYIKEKNGNSEIRCLDKCKNKLNNIISSIKKEYKNNSFINKEKGNSLRPKSYSHGKNYLCKKFSVKFVNPYCKQSAIEEKKKIYHFSMRKNKEKNPLYDIIQKIKKQESKDIKKKDKEKIRNKNKKLIPHCKIDIRIDKETSRNNYKPMKTEKKRNCSVEPNNNNHIYHTINSANRTKGIYQNYKKYQPKISKINLKLNTKIPKQYSQSFINDNNCIKYNNKGNNKRNYSFQNKNTAIQKKQILNSSNKNSRTNSNFLPQSKRTVPKYYIIKSPFEKSNIQSARQSNKNKRSFLTKIKKSPSNYICTTNANTSSNYTPNITTTNGNNIIKTENTIETIPSSFRLNSENNKFKKMVCYANKMYKDFKEKGKIPTKKRHKANSITRKIQATIIKTNDDRKKSSNLSFTRSNSRNIK